MTPYESEISSLPPAIQRSVAPAGQTENAGVRAQFEVPPSKELK
jgi:hypothetical protein